MYVAQNTTRHQPSMPVVIRIEFEFVCLVSTENAKETRICFTVVIIWLAKKCVKNGQYIVFRKYIKASVSMCHCKLPLGSSDIWYIYRSTGC